MWPNPLKIVRLPDFGRQFRMKSASSRRTTPSAASNTGVGAVAWTDLALTENEAVEVVEACKNGDPVAQRRLYDASHQNVYRLVVRMVGVQDAADVTQQVFLQAFRKIAQFSGRSQFGTWIYRVAVNESLQHLRKAKRSRMQILEQEPTDCSPDGQQNVEDKELLEQALTQLEPELRSTFLLREIEGLSYGAIAEALEIPEGTVGSRLNRARRELKHALVELGWEP
jgi:RNA polymerase sigma-70 factor (ECF subfamily)